MTYEVPEDMRPLETVALSPEQDREIFGPFRFDDASREREFREGVLGTIYEYARARAWHGWHGTSALERKRASAICSAAANLQECLRDIGPELDRVLQDALEDDIDRVLRAIIEHAEWMAAHQKPEKGRPSNDPMDLAVLDLCFCY